MSLVRLLRAEDVAPAMMLSTAAGWNQTDEDWRRMLRLSPEGCWCVEDQGGVVATATLVMFGELGWIGMVLTDPAYRRRGLARALMQTALDHAEALGARTLKLDATEFGRALYESLGFVTEEIVERWERVGEWRSTIQGEDVEDSSFAARVDGEAFGADRSRLLRDLGAHGPSSASQHGFAMARVGRTGLYLGPCVSESAEEAEQLIRGLMEANARARWYWDLLPSNLAAVALAKRSGFERQRSLWRMRRGEPRDGDTTKMYAIAGFEFG
jgi:GNAT superfamily N-acetyltransferase